jgi:uncharacterized protein
MEFALDTKNKKLARVAERVNKNKTLQTYWVCSNITSIDRMKIHDHGKTHVYLTVNNALQMMRLLKQRGIYPSLVQDYALNKNIKKYKLDYNDAEIVVFLAACLHDIGVSLHRKAHSMSSIQLAAPLLDQILYGIYPEEEKTIMKAEVLHCIITHNSDAEPLTMEAAIVRVADALDLTEGRAKIPFLAGTRDAHAISAMAIKQLKITTSEEKPIVVNITMGSPAGIFQVDELLKSKIKGSKLEEYFRIEATIDLDRDDPHIPKRMTFG